MTRPDPHQQPYQGQYPQQPYNNQPYPQQQGYPPQPYAQQPPPGYGQPYPPPPARSVRKERGLSGKSHGFHLMATIFTCGLWGMFVWLPLWIYRMVVRRRVVTRHYYE